MSGLPSIPAVSPEIAAGLQLLQGALSCFLGYRLFKVMLGLYGFLTGALLAYSAASAYAENPQVAAVVGLIVGVLGAVLFVKLYWLGIFALGAAVGAAVGWTAILQAGVTPERWMLPAAALAAGVIAVFLRKFMIILSTSFLGALSLVLVAAAFLIKGFSPAALRSGSGLDPDHSLYLMIAWGVLGLFGMVVQYRNAPATPPTDTHTQRTQQSKFVNY